VRLSIYFILLFSLLVVSVAAEGWPDKVKLSGDMRYRHETIDAEEYDSATEEITAYSQNRHRIRARLKVLGTVTEDFSAVIRFGLGGEDPTAVNQTLTGSFSRKDIYLDLAYFDYKSSRVPGLEIWGGKMLDPFFRAGDARLIWDKNTMPEGLAASYAIDYDKLEFKINLAGFWIEERKKGPDSYTAWMQGVFDYPFGGDKGRLHWGASYFSFINAQGFKPFFDSTKGYGNTLDADGRYLWDYDIAEFFVELDYNMSAIPFVLAFDYARNAAADSNNTGYEICFHAGKLSGPGTWKLSYFYRYLESDVVIGRFADGLFGGGGTDQKGFEGRLSYMMGPNTEVGAVYYHSAVGLDRKLDYDRLMLDLRLYFK